MQKYYNLNYTPAIGFYYILYYMKYSKKQVSLYSVFLLFPLFWNDDFLDYICSRKRTYDFYRIINDYVISHKNNDFWLEYFIHYNKMRRLCFESIIFGILADSLKLSDNKLSISRFLNYPIEGNKYKNRLNSIIKLSQVTENLSYYEIIQIMKVGEYYDQN